MEMFGLVPLVMVQVAVVLSQVVVSLLDVLHLVVDASLGEVVVLSHRGATVHSLPFVAFVLLDRDGSGLTMVVPILVGMIGWIVLTPLWSRWLSTGFTLLVLIPELSCLLTHVLIFEFRLGVLGNVWLIDSGCSRHMTGDLGWFSSLTSVVSKVYITFEDNGRGRVLSEREVRVSDKLVLKCVDLVKSLGFNLLSVSQLLDEGFEVLFKSGASRILDARGDLVCMVVPEGQIFWVDFS
jgi:hypothetical protein